MCHGMTAHPFSNNVIETEKTLYGACEKNGEYRCAIYSNSCEGDELWLSPIELGEIGIPECTCEKVLVGSCINPFSDSCVVSSESCDKESDFISAFATKEQGKECLLCQSNVFEDDNDEYNNDDDNDDDNVEVEATELNDDRYKSVPQPIDGVSKKSYSIVLGFMFAAMTVSIILSILIFMKKRGTKSVGRQVEKTGSVL